MLDGKLHSFIRDFDEKTREFNSNKLNALKEIDDYGNDYFYQTKGKMNQLMQDIDEQNSYNLMLQRQITTLKKEKTDLTIDIKNCNDMLDKIERDLGISIKGKRKKE